MENLTENGWFWISIALAVAFFLYWWNYCQAKPKSVNGSM